MAATLNNFFKVNSFKNLGNAIRTFSCSSQVRFDSLFCLFSETKLIIVYIWFYTELDFKESVPINF